LVLKGGGSNLCVGNKNISRIFFLFARDSELKSLKIIEPTKIYNLEFGSSWL
jgi:hypothetical protein